MLLVTSAVTLLGTLLLLALVMADHVAWPRVYQAMAAVMLIPVIAVLMSREPEVLRVQVTTWSEGLYVGVVEPFLDFFRRFGAALALAIAEASGGAFDPCLGDLTERWGFGCAGPVDAVPIDGEEADRGDHAPGASASAVSIRSTVT